MASSLVDRLVAPFHPPISGLLTVYVFDTQLVAHITFLYGNDETEFLEKVKIFVKPPIRRDETGWKPPYVEINVGFDLHHRMEFPKAA